MLAGRGKHNVKDRRRAKEEEGGGGGGEEEEEEERKRKKWKRHQVVEMMRIMDCLPKTQWNGTKHAMGELYIYMHKQPIRLSANKFIVGIRVHMHNKIINK